MHPELQRLLRGTSRSFYLTLRVLPRAIRSQIGLAYLLARTTDTIADTDAVPPAERRDALARLRKRILGPSSTPLDLTRFATETKSASPADRTVVAERRLLLRIEDALAALGRFPAADQNHVREVLSVIISGQDLDLQRFAGASASNIISLHSEAELDDYTWRVAGCVGEFWTKMCRAHLFPSAPLDEAQFLADAVRFGKGLQLVNILRDLPRDLRQGRCYLPAEQLRAASLAPADLLVPENITRLRPVYDTWLEIAEGHLAAGWRYTNTIPPGHFRLRLACAWPVLIGVRTLGLLRAGNPIDPARRIKVSRGQVRGILLRSLVKSPFAGAWRSQFAQERRACEG